MSGGDTAEQVIRASGLCGRDLVREVMAAADCDEADARWMIAFYAGHGFEFEEVSRLRPSATPLTRLEQALVVEDRRAAYGPGVGGNALNALTAELSSARDWPGLIDVREELARRAELTSTPNQDRCRFGVSVVDDELARAAPARYAVRGIERKPSVKRLEDLAATRTWAELAPFIDDARIRRLIAYERVARGENLSEASFPMERGDLPFALEPWEPRSYVDPRDNERSRHVSVDVVHETHDLPVAPAVQDRLDPVCEKLEAMWGEWDLSEALRVQGNALEAIAALEYTTAEVAELPLPDALTAIARSIAWGGLHKYGGLLAHGRQAAWELLATLTGKPLSQLASDELETTGTRMRWYSYLAEHDAYEWIITFQLAIEHPKQNLAWAMQAGDTD